MTKSQIDDRSKTVKLSSNHDIPAGLADQPGADLEARVAALVAFLGWPNCRFAPTVTLEKLVRLTSSNAESKPTNLEGS